VGRAPSAPKLKPNDAWTEDGLQESVCGHVDVYKKAYPAPRTRCWRCSRRSTRVLAISTAHVNICNAHTDWRHSDGTRSN
jgi:hypothetical protein